MCLLYMSMWIRIAMFSFSNSYIKYMYYHRSLEMHLRIYVISFDECYANNCSSYVHNCPSVCVTPFIQGTTELYRLTNRIQVTYLRRMAFLANKLVDSTWPWLYARYLHQRMWLCYWLSADTMREMRCYACNAFLTIRSCLPFTHWTAFEHDRLNTLTNWTPFRRSHFQGIFLQWKRLNSGDSQGSRS